MTDSGKSWRSDSRIREDIDFYLEMRAREFMDKGLSPEDAARAARDAFGDPNEVVAQCQAARIR
jgi:hypothetical protein